MSTADLVWIGVSIATILGLFALAIREVVLANRVRARVAGWIRAGAAREPGTVILRGRAWSDEQAPIAALPVNIIRDPKTGAPLQEEEGLATTRPFWLSTNEGDVAIDARPEVSTLIAPKLPNAPFGHVIRQVFVGAEVEVYGRLAREHVPGAIEGFRDGGASWSLHGDEHDKLRLAHEGRVTSGVEARRFYALGVLIATIVWAAGCEYFLITEAARGEVDVTPVFQAGLFVVIALAIAFAWRRSVFPKG